MWKRVVCAKYGAMDKELQWKWKLVNSASPFIKAVIGLLNEGAVSACIIKDGVKVGVGYGDKASFWDDVWSDSVWLKSSFLGSLLCLT